MLTGKEIEKALEKHKVMNPLFSQRFSYRCGYEDALKEVGEWLGSLHRDMWDDTVYVDIEEHIEPLKEGRLP